MSRSFARCPILAILYFVYFGLPGVGILFSPFEAGTIGLGVVYSTYLAEVLRAGVDSLHRGQREAALAVGMPPLMLFRYIVLPQAVRTVLPPLLIALISLLKDSSICALIAVNELTLSGRVIMSQSFLAAACLRADRRDLLRHCLADVALCALAADTA